MLIGPTVSMWHRYCYAQFTCCARGSQQILRKKYEKETEPNWRL